ncbi:recombinase family protein [Butyricicoccus sp.]|uniref:recombinase family protein n=1 Tax=Butyricicoccus sp. TaxID=2049021 RepID=UPI003F149B9E
MRKNGDIIAIYSRKSKFTGKGESIDNQIELCRDYIRVHYGDPAADHSIVYEDEGFSGGNLNRPDFKQMMQDAHAHKFRAIVVYRLDRISRNVSDFSSLIEELNRLDIAFISIREQFDTGTPMGRAMMYIASVFSQLERETIAERIRDNMHELAKTGRWLGGTTPTGYTSESVKHITVDGKSKKSCHLKLLPEEAEIVRKIFDLFIETDSLTAVDAELLRQHITTKTGRKFTRFSIKNILQNPVYLIADQDAYDYFTAKHADLFSDLSDFDGIHGILAYHRTNQQKGHTTVNLPIEDWIICVGKHPGIIPAKTWIRVQESLERNKSKAYRTSRNNKALLTGLLFCRCGNRMYPKLSKRKTIDGEPVFTYVCKLKERSKRSRCNRRNVNGNALDAAVIEEVKKLSEDKQGFIAQLEKSRNYDTGNRDGYDTRLANLRAEQAQKERNISALVDSLAELGDSAAKGHVAKRIEELHRCNEELSARIAELESLASRHTLSDAEFDTLSQLLSVFHDSMDAMSVEQKRAALRTVVCKVIWDGKYAHIILSGASEDETAYPDADELPDETLSDACSKAHRREDSK